MPERQRKPVGRGYRQEFNLLEAMAARDVSTELEAVWSDAGSGQGGDALDDLMTNLGSAYIEAGRVQWIEEPGLHRVFIDYFKRSVTELNNRLQDGTLTLDENGNISPTASEETPA
jgi:hypothetical protein